jgi:FMN reductase
VVSAGLSQPSSSRLLADRLADAAGSSLDRLGFGVELTMVEVRHLAHDVVDNLLTGFPPPRLKEAVDAVVGADGLIVVTPIFNASYSGLFKSFFDVFEESALADKPALLAATGGTARHSLVLDHALRPMFAYLRAAVVPTSLFAATQDWAGPGGAGGALVTRIERAAGELAEAMSRRTRKPVQDPYALPKSFDHLLAGD